MTPPLRARVSLVCLGARGDGGEDPGGKSDGDEVEAGRDSVSDDGCDEEADEGEDEKDDVKHAPGVSVEGRQSNLIYDGMPNFPCSRGHSPVARW